MERNGHVKTRKVKLSQVRKETKTTQEEICQLLGVDRSYLSRFENGKVRIEWIEKAVKLQKFLKEAGYSIEDLIIPTLDEKNT